MLKLLREILGFNKKFYAYDRKAHEEKKFEI